VDALLLNKKSYVVKTLNISTTIGYLASFAEAIGAILFNPVAGIVSDRVGRTRYLIAVGVVLLFAIFPIFLLLTSRPTAAVIVLSVLALGTLKALYLGALAALMSELFPAATRATGLGLSYNIGVTVFGGMGPVIMTWLGTFALIGNLAPGYYLTAVCIFSLWALVTIRLRAADCYGA